MFKPHTVLGFGLWLIAIFFLGISDDWKILLYVITGIYFVLVYLTYLARVALLRLARESQNTSADTFKENGRFTPTSEPEKDI